MKQFLSIYIHWPFCKSKCPYCDFNSHVREEIDHNDWHNAYLAELEYFKDLIKDKNIVSIFFGGGTPSLMPPYIVESIINKLSQLAKLTDSTEITLEANPTSVEMDNFCSLRLAGVNRISLGIQSLNTQDLKFLGRNHSSLEAKKAIDLAANIFKNYSFDLIYALPDQSFKTWEIELESALKLAGNHLSLYQLTIEKGTNFFVQVKNKIFKPLDDDNAASMYQLTNDIMKANNMPAYEISNYAHEGYKCKHNLAYWQYDEYLGIGPGAHSRIDNRAIMMIHNPENWLNKVKENGAGIQQDHVLTLEDKISEYLLMGLRLKDGINAIDFKLKTGIDLINAIDQNKLHQLIIGGLITYDSNNLCISNNGILMTNKIISELIKS